MTTQIASFICIILLTFISCQPAKSTLQSGHITNSKFFNGGVYRINTDSLLDQPYITIEKDNIELDFNQTTLDGRSENHMPDEYTGIAIHVRNCRNVTIKNLNIHGFKIAILAENVENLKIISSNFSYNYRPKLHSKWDREALSDWLYFHNNENDEWKNFGAAVYLKNCNNAIIKNVLCHNGMNGLLMVNCRKSLVYNNDIRFNSGLGIGLYRSSHNSIIHNKLDWNVRGYSHGKYSRGQDSSAILLYEQSSHNTIAFNSATHSGDGLFLWAGQSTMDTGLGGCDSNMIYRNDFSHSIANGIEVTFSANYMIENILNDCTYGVWGGYSHHSVIRGNEIKNCETGIAIEHGRYNLIENNIITDGKKGIRLWGRPTQPADWAYAQKLNVASRQYRIADNHFENLSDALDISYTDSIWTSNNTFLNVEQEGSYTSQSNDHFLPWMDIKTLLPEPVVNTQSTVLSSNTLRGRKYIIINEWGPYDFQYPVLALRNKNILGDNEHLHFDIYGPPGEWQLVSIEGCTISEKTYGKIPDSLTISCNLDSIKRNLHLSYKGAKIITQFGDTISAGTQHDFSYEASFIRTNWNVSFFKYDSLSDPLQYPLAFKRIFDNYPLKTLSTNQLAFRWWNQPDPLVPPDKFGVKASTTINVPTGEYTLHAESDDGIRIWFDGVMLLEHWDIHTPAIDEVKFTATKGPHTLMVEYFEAGGLAVLDVTISRN
jgi:parallel beta-helix repeat protein